MSLYLIKVLTIPRFLYSFLIQKRNKRVSYSHIYYLLYLYIVVLSKPKYALGGHQEIILINFNNPLS